jgi:serine protease Do
MTLATELIKYFFVDFDVCGKENQIKTIDDFVNSNPHYNTTLDISEVSRICSRFEYLGLLIHGNTGNYPFLEKSYFATNFDEKRAEYGEYEFIVHGFPLIRQRLTNSVRPVVVTKPNGDEDIGTCFLTGNIHTLVTARHVIENMSKVTILGNTGKPVDIRQITVSEDDNLDVAILLIGYDFDGTQPFRFANPNILDEVLCIGYPPIPGFADIQISDISHISSTLKSSHGRIVAESSSYLDRQSYLLLNARVKGGNSGGPIINNKGYVVGILVQIPLDPQDESKLDALAYGIAVPRDAFMQLLQGPDNPAPSVKNLPFKNLEEGGFSTILC